MGKKTKTALQPLQQLLTVIAQALLVAYSIEPLMESQSTIHRSLVGFAATWASINVAIYVYKYIVKPSATAISNNG